MEARSGLKYEREDANRVTKTIENSHGTLLFSQPMREIRLQQAFYFAFTVLFGGLAMALAFLGPASNAAILLLATVAALASVFTLLGLVLRPVRLYDKGIEFPHRIRPAFWPYSEIRDINLVRDGRGRPSGLLVTRRDGRFIWGGTMWSSEASFGSARLEEIASLIRKGVTKEGGGPLLEWSPSAWARIQSLLLRGAIAARLEAMARQRGMSSIDDSFVERAQQEDKVLRRWLTASEAALAQRAPRNPYAHR